MNAGTRFAEKPFEIYTLAHVSRRGGQTAATLRELREGLRICSDESIYHHTAVALRSRFGSAESVRNDFAEWVCTSLERRDLADQLAAADEVEYEGLHELRSTLSHTLDNYLKAFPEAANEMSEKPFHFCEGMEVLVPVDTSARTLRQFRRCVEEMTGKSLYLHFVAPKSRLEQQSNDFSIWLEDSLGMEELAGRINAIEITQMTLEEVRHKILILIDEEGQPRELKMAAHGGS